MREKGRKNPKHKKTSTEKSKGKVKVGEKTWCENWSKKKRH